MVYTLTKGSPSKHRWFSGRMLACHAGGPGSIPGRCKKFFRPAFLEWSVSASLFIIQPFQTRKKQCSTFDSSDSVPFFRRRTGSSINTNDSSTTHATNLFRPRKTDANINFESAIWSTTQGRVGVSACTWTQEG